MAVAQPAFVNRVLAVVNLSEIDEDRYNPLTTMDTAPHLFLASGLSDQYSTLNLSLEDFGPVTHDAYSRGMATTQGAPLTVLNNVGAGHGGNQDHPFISLWLDSVLSQRLPAVLPVSAPVNLPGWQACSSWVGTYGVTVNSAAPWNSGVQTTNNIIAARFAYTNSQPFTWLPSQNNASAWQAYANSGYMSAFDPAITSSTSAVATVRSSFSYEITALGDPANYGATNLPAGLFLDPTNGVISGNPSAGGIFPITISAENGLGTATTNLDLTVLNPFSVKNFSLNPANSNLVMVYNTMTGGNYTIQATTNLASSWTTISNLVATGSATTNTLPKSLLGSILGSASGTQTFIRVCAP